MIKVSVMYPNTPGARFDHDYYRDKHMSLIKSGMGAALKYYTVEKGLTGKAPDAPAAFVGMCPCCATPSRPTDPRSVRTARRSRGTFAITPT